MSHDASHAKDVAKSELAKRAAVVEEERKAREKELAERRSAVQATAWQISLVGRAREGR